MKMVSMANKPEDPKEGAGEGKNGAMCSDCGDAKYPYGTQLSLGDDQLEALGITDLPKIGTVLTIQAKVKVVAARSEEDQDGSADNTLSLQITDLGIDGTMSETEKAATMFSGNEE
jgi:hypothetical protein